MILSRGGVAKAQNGRKQEKQWTIARVDGPFSFISVSEPSKRVHAPLCSRKTGVHGDSVSSYCFLSSNNEATS